MRVFPAEVQGGGSGGATGGEGALRQVLGGWGPHDPRPAPPLPRGGSGRGTRGPAEGGGGGVAEAAPHYEVREAQPQPRRLPSLPLLPRTQPPHHFSGNNNSLSLIAFCFIQLLANVWKIKFWMDWI